MPRILQPEQFTNGLKLAGTGALFVAGVIAAWAYWGHHFWTALKGPTEVSIEEIAKLEDPSDLPSTWVKVHFKRGFHSNVVLEEVRNGVSSIDEEYIIFQAGERWMIAGVPPGFKGNEVSGQIWRNNAPLAREVVAAVSDEFKDLHKGKLFPFEFDAGDDYGSNWICFAGVMGFFALCGGFLTFVGLGGVYQGFRPSPSTTDFDAFVSAGSSAGFSSTFTAAASLPTPGSSAPSGKGEVEDVMARILRESRR
jgi:hypothetical protein